MKNKNIQFYGLLDFYPRKEQIKKHYELLTQEEIEIYKMYVYSLPFEDDYVKDLIWEYLNGWRDAMFDLAIQYRKKKEKNKKRQEYYEKERIENEMQYVE